MKQLLAFWEKTLNLPSERIAEILFKKADDGETLTEEVREEAIAELLELDKARVSKLKAEAGTTFDNGYKKAEKEVTARWEKNLREKFGVETDAAGEDLLAAILEKAKTKPAGNASDDDIKKHQLYLQLEQQYLRDVKEAKEAGEKALEEFKAQQSAMSVKGTAKNKAKDLLLGMKPVLEEDPTISETRIQDFLRELEGFDFQEIEGGVLVPIKDGKRVENDHSHPVSFEDLTKQIAAKRFKFQVQDPKGNSGNQNEPGKSGNVSYSGKVPANETELWQTYSTLKDPTQQKALMDAYEKANGEIKVG